MTDWLSSTWEANWRSFQYFNLYRLVLAALFFLALLGAYSRVYLSQHFFEDIYAGSFVGLIAALIAHRLVVVRRSKSTALESTEIAETEPEL